MLKKWDNLKVVLFCKPRYFEYAAGKQAEFIR